MASKGLRLFAYGRVSDVRGGSGESFISPEEQMSKCRSYAKTYEHVIVEEGLDLDVSGGVMSRPVLDHFLAGMKDGQAQGLIVAKLDRFFRSSRGALNALAEIEAAGGVLISVQEQIDSTTDAGRLVRSIFLATAEWERERIGQSWQSAKARAVERGVHISRHVPPGYRRGSGGRLEPHPRHGKTITKAFELAAKGTASADIARYLTRHGLPSGDNGHTAWASNRIKRLLSNRVYLGEARSGTGKKGAANYTNPRAHAPLVDEPTFLLAQRKPSTAPVSSTSTYLLTGFVRCAGCSHSMRPQKARGKTIATFRCAESSCPHPSSIGMRRLEDYVYEEFAERIFAKPNTPPVARADSEAVAALEEAQEALGELEAIKDTLRPAAYAQALDAALGEIEVAQREISSRRTRSEIKVDDLTPQFEEAYARIADGGRPLDGYDEAATKLLRASIASEVAAVFVRPAASRARNLPIEDRVRIVWRGEEELELPTRGATFGVKTYTWQ